MVLERYILTLLLVAVLNIFNTKLINKNWQDIKFYVR